MYVLFRDVTNPSAFFRTNRSHHKTYKSNVSRYSIAIPMRKKRHHSQWHYHRNHCVPTAQMHIEYRECTTSDRMHTISNGKENAVIWILLGFLHLIFSWQKSPFVVSLSFRSSPNVKSKQRFFFGAIEKRLSHHSLELRQSNFIPSIRWHPIKCGMGLLSEFCIVLLCESLDHALLSHKSALACALRTMAAKMQFMRFDFGSSEMNSSFRC